MEQNSKFLQLKSKDFWEGLIMAGFSSATATIGTAAAMVADFTTFGISTLVKAFGVGAVIGFSGYLSKHLFTNSDGQALKSEN